MRINKLFAKIFINTTSQIIAKIINLFIGFLTIGIITRYLGVEKYGIYNLVFAYLSFFSIFGDFGLQLTLIRDLSIDTTKNYKSIYFTLKIILTLISLFLSLISLIFFPYSIIIKQAIIVGSIAVTLGQINAYGASVLQSKVRLDAVAIIEVVNRLITASSIILFIYLNLGLNSILIAVSIGNLISIIINFLITPEYYRINFNHSFDKVKQVFITSLPIGITTLLAIFYFKVDILMLSVMKSSTDVGIYSLSYKCFENIIVLWGYFMASIYPLMAKYVNLKDNFNLRKIIKLSLVCLVIFSLIGIVLGNLTSPLIIKLLGGKDFDLSVFPLRLLLLSIPFTLFNNILYHLYLSLSKIYEIIFILLFSLCLNFFINLLLIPHFSYIGTSLSTIITELFISISYLLLFIFFKKNNTLFNINYDK